MMFTTRRSSSRIDISNYSTLLYRDYDANVNFTKNYFLSQSPPPMTYRDLRSVMSNVTPSNVVILSEPTSSLTKSSSLSHRRKYSSKKKRKYQAVDVYRTLPRSESRCSLVGEREITNDELMLLTSSFVIDHVTPSPTNGFFHPQNLPNIQKNRIKTANNQTKSTNKSSPSLRIEQVGHKRTSSFEVPNKDFINRMSTASHTRPIICSSSPIPRSQSIRYTQPSPPQLVHRTTPVDIQYEEDRSQIVTTLTTTTTDFSTASDALVRKQLHVYMPQIISC